MKIYACPKELDTYPLSYSLVKSTHRKMKQAALLKNAGMRCHKFGERNNTAVTPPKIALDRYKLS